MDSHSDYSADQRVVQLSQDISLSFHQPDDYKDDKSHPHSKILLPTSN